jgi:predicted Zn-dependent protease
MATWFGLSSVSLDAGTAIKPSWNFFTPQQDIEMGREASQQAEKQLVILNDPATTNYLSRWGKLAAKSLRPDYPWQFKVANDSAINAFALPGGFICIAPPPRFKEFEPAFKHVIENVRSKNEGML